MSDGYAVLGGQDGVARPDGWHTDASGTRWAYYGVYVTSQGRMAVSMLVSRYTVGVVFRDAAPMGPRQRRRFTRFEQRTVWWRGDPAEWFTRSAPFGRARDLIAAADAAGTPFRRPRILWGAGVGPSP